MKKNIAIKFLDAEFRDRELDVQNWQVEKIYLNVLAASTILSKKELVQLIDDHVELSGLSIYE